MNTINKRHASTLLSLYSDFSHSHFILDCFLWVRVSETQKQKVMAVAKAKEIISSTPVVVFSKTYCPYCVSVKKLLTQIGASFKAIELDTEGDGNEIQSALHQISGQRTVPNVFISGKHIGGCDATTAMHKDGKLVPLLTEAGALVKASASATA